MDRGRLMQKLSDYEIGYGIHFPAGHRLGYIQERYKIKEGDVERDGTGQCSDYSLCRCFLT